VPTLEQIRHVIRTLPATTEIERRDRALIAFTILTGARDGAIASLKAQAGYSMERTSGHLWGGAGHPTGGLRRRGEAALLGPGEEDANMKRHYEWDWPEEPPRRSLQLFSNRRFRTRSSS
jgi:hypothetical protein